VREEEGRREWDQRRVRRDRGGNGRRVRNRRKRGRGASGA